MSVATGVLLVARLARDVDAEPRRPVPVASEQALAPPPRREVVARPVVHAEATTHAEEAPVPDDPPEREDPPIGFGTPGERSGIALFPPPGTKPIRRGLVVPEDFELPPGYVRHYQATDDGQRVPAILMFSPDYEWLDDEGQVVALPEDRIVPPEMAPPGMPLQMLELPKDTSEPEPAP